MCVKYATIMEVAKEKDLMPNKEDIVNFCTRVLQSTTKDDLMNKNGVFQSTLYAFQTMVIPMAYFVIDKALPAKADVCFEKKVTAMSLAFAHITTTRRMTSTKCCCNNRS